MLAQIQRKILLFVLAWHLHYYDLSSQVFINFATEKIGMETIPIDSEDEFDNLDSIKEVET